MTYIIASRAWQIENLCEMLINQEETVMKKTFSVILTVLAVSWNSGIYAERGMTQQSPESILTCTDITKHGVFSVLSTSIPTGINAEQCRTWDIIQPPDLCSGCIDSLENQGCKIIDVDTVQVDDNVTETLGYTKIIYLLSCIKP